MSQYEVVDKLILERLKEGEMGMPFFFVNVGKVRTECERVGLATGREPYRILDGRLQALRKAMKIQHDSKFGWRLRVL